MQSDSFSSTQETSWRNRIWNRGYGSLRLWEQSQTVSWYLLHATVYSKFTSRANFLWSSTVWSCFHYWATFAWFGWQSCLSICFYLIYGGILTTCKDCMLNQHWFWFGGSLLVLELSVWHNFNLLRSIGLCQSKSLQYLIKANLLRLNTWKFYKALCLTQCLSSFLVEWRQS